MQLEHCSQCDCGKKRPIVNKHFKLCEAKNKERLQVQKVQVLRSSGESGVEESGRVSGKQYKRQGIQRVRTSKGTERRVSKRNEKRGREEIGVVRSSTGIRLRSRVKNKRLQAIRKRSEKNRYKCSDGSFVTQTEITANYIEVCQQIDQERERCCEGCGKNRPLSHSHLISKKACKWLHKTELIWDKNNIRLHCFCESDACHQRWENMQVVGMLDLLENLNYVASMDIELFNKINAKIDCNL